MTTALSYPVGIIWSYTPTTSQDELFEDNIDNDDSEEGEVGPELSQDESDDEIQQVTARGLEHKAYLCHSYGSHTKIYMLHVHTNGRKRMGIFPLTGLKFKCL